MVPRNALNTRLWYNTKLTESIADATDFAPGSLWSISTANSVGEIWVHYTVHLSGTSP